MRPTQALKRRFDELTDQSDQPLNVARFLSHLDEPELLSLASCHNNIEALVDTALLPILQGLAAAEKLPLNTPKIYKNAHARLMQLASAEYAYRRDWVLYNVQPTLLLPVAEQIVTTDIGHVMFSVIGKNSPSLTCLRADKISPM